MIKLTGPSLYSLIICLFCILPTAHAQEAGRNPFQQPLDMRAALSQSMLPQQALPPEQTSLKVYALSYAQAQELAPALQDMFSGKIGVDKLSNSLLFRGTPTEHNLLQSMLSQLDTASRQVTLEAKIIAISQENNKSLGISWNWDTIPQREVSSDNEDTGSEGTANSFGGNFKFWHGYAFRFNATLNALISNGKAKVLAKPRIISIPGREASIFIGDHIPVQTEKHDSSGSYTATEYLDAGIKLQYTPLISKDGKMVTARVHTEVSTPVLISELKNYRITSRTADTNVRMFSGETLIIGGLINEEEQNTLQKIPFLGDLPLLGHLFRNHTKKRARVEVILLLTPHISEAGRSPAIYQDSID